MRVRSPSPTPCPPAQGSGARKISSHNFWLQNTAGAELVEETVESQEVPLEEPTHGLTQIHSLELQHWHSSLKGTSGIQGGTEVSDIQARAGGQLSPRQKGRQRPLSLF